MSKIREAIFMAATILLCVLLFGVKFTGGIWHAVIGVMLVISSVSHICLRMAKMKYRTAKVKIADEVLLAALAVLFVTGMLMHPMQEVLLVKILHKLSGVVFSLGLITHIVQHKKMGKKAGNTEARKRQEKNREGAAHVS